MNNTFEQTKGIVEKILSQAQQGQIEFNGWRYYIKFDTHIEGKKSGAPDGHLTINIPDYNTFIWKIDRYLKKAVPFYNDEKVYYELTSYGFKKKLVMCLFLNLSSYDAENIYEYLDVRTKMLDNNFSIDKASFGKLNYLKNKQQKEANISASIRKNLSNLEAPYKMVFTLGNSEGKFILPAVTFGVVKDVAYVYAVQQLKEPQQGRIIKDLDRYFRKLNKGVVSESEEYHTIAQISPNALASMTLFCKFLKSYGVKNIIAKDFLPLRYTAVYDNPVKKTQERLERLDYDQFNMTNKFMYLFLRYSHHFPACKAEYNDIKGEMRMNLQECQPIDDNIIYSLDDGDEREIYL